MAHNDDDVRVGTPERERAISLLNDAFSTGYLEVSEFEERSGVVFASRTRGELRGVVADLPNRSMLFPDPPAATHPSGPDGVPAVELNADWETVRRRGSWQVPSRLMVTGTMGTVDLDLRAARFAGPTVDLEVQVSGTTIKLRLADDQEVRLDDLVTTGLSSTKDKAGPALRPGGPVITVRGSLAALSAVVVKR